MCMKKTLLILLCLFLGNLTVLQVAAQETVKNRAYYENLGSAVLYANSNTSAGEDSLYGGGHGLVIRASVSPTWTSTSLAGSGIAEDPNKDQFCLTTPYRAIFKDDYCNRTGYFTHDAPTRVYLGGFKPIGEGGVEEDVYFTVLRTGTANGTPDEEWQGRGTNHPDLRPNGTVGFHNGELIGGYVVVGKGLTPGQLTNVRNKIQAEESGDSPEYESYEESFITGMYLTPTFCSETAAENAASYANVPGGSRTITIPSFIMLDQEFADSENELGATYKGRHLILKVVGIDFGAFSDVEHTHFILPKGITYIGDSGLRRTGFSAPKKISFHKGSNVYPFIGETCTDEEWVANNNIESLGHYAMSYAQYDSIYQVINSAKFREFGERCFQGWDNITKVDMNKTPLVKKISKGAFAQCHNITEVIISPSIQELSDRAFYQCTSLTDLSFVASGGDPTGETMALTRIGDNAFEGADISTFLPPASLKKIGSYAFYGNNLGAGGRFDLPTHIDSIGQYAFANNNISYIPFVAGTDAAPENPVNSNGLFLGYRSFYEDGTDVTVEFNAKVPPRIISDGRPFDTDSTHRVRIIVPLSCGERYVHGFDENEQLLPISGLFSKEYHHHEYRVKFDLTKEYTKPNYGHYTSKDGGTYTYSKAPWWVASTSWTLDSYVLKPSHGGTVDTWASSNTTNNMGESKTLWTPTIDFYIDPNDSTVHGAQHVFPRTAHQYFDNENHDDVPKIATMEVEDAILPPDEGMLFAYTQPAIYLMPLYADYGEIAKLIKTVPQKFGVEVGSPGVADPPTSLTRVNIHSRLLTFDSDENLRDMAGKPWLDFNDHTARWRQIAVWNDAGTDYEIKEYDLLNMRDRAGNPITIDFSKTVTVQKGYYKRWAAKSDGTSLYEAVGTGASPDKGSDGKKKYEVTAPITVKKYDYWTSSSGRPYRCSAGFNRFTIPAAINWVEACEAGTGYLRTLLGNPTGVQWVTPNYSKINDKTEIGSDGLHKLLYYRFVPCTHKYVTDVDITIKGVSYVKGDTVYCGNEKNTLPQSELGVTWGYGKAHIEDWHCRQWIDIFDLIQEWGTDIGEIKARHDFHDNHTDHGNILVPCVEPTYVWPFWETVTQETYLTDSASNPLKVSVARKYFQQDSGEWDYTPYYVSGRPSVVMNGDEYADGFISFGLSNGYFVQTQNPGYTRANRAYFRVHSSVLMKDLYNPTVSPTNRMVIVDEDHVVSGLGEISTGLNGVKASPVRDVWYTIEGRKLNNQPTQRGVYINNGRKVVIK